MVSKKFMRIASSKYYESNKFTVNKNRILAKIKNEKGYVPKLSTLIKYKIEGTPKPTKLQESVDKLEAEAIKRLGKTTFDELQKEARRRIANEATGTVITDSLSDLTEAERTERRKNLVVTQAEIHQAFIRLSENDLLSVKSAKSYSNKFDEIITWLGGDSESNIIKLLEDPEEVKSKISKGFGNKRNQKTGEPLKKTAIKDYAGWRWYGA